MAYELQLPALVPGELMQGGAAVSPQIAAAAAKDPGLMAKLFAKLKSGAGAAKTGLGKFGEVVGKAAPWVAGGLEAAQGVQTMSKIGKNSGSLNDLKTNLMTEAAGNPLYSSMLDTADTRQLQALKRGNMSNESDKFGSVVSGAMQSAPGALLSGAAGAMIPGMQWLLPIAAAQLANGGLKGFAKGQDQDAATLQGLYDRLSQASQTYKQARLQKNFGAYGMQAPTTLG